MRLDDKNESRRERRKTKFVEASEARKRINFFATALKNSSFIVLAALRNTIFLQPHIAFFNFSFIWSNFVLSFYEFFFLSSLMLVIYLLLYVHVTNRKSWNISHPTSVLPGFYMVEEKCTHWQKNWKNSTLWVHPPFPTPRSIRNEK